MGLADEIEQLILQATKRTPWVLEAITTENLREALSDQFREKSREDINRLLYWVLLETTAAQTEALIRLAREIESLKESQNL